MVTLGEWIVQGPGRVIPYMIQEYLVEEKLKPNEQPQKVLKKKAICIMTKVFQKIN